MLNIIETYIYVVDFMFILHGREDCMHFKYDWVLMLYVPKGMPLSWGAILSLTLKKFNENVQTHS
jgi:hypothetical protein